MHAAAVHWIRRHGQSFADQTAATLALNEAKATPRRGATRESASKEVPADLFVAIGPF